MHRHTPRFRSFLFLFALLLLSAAGPIRAQLDLGSQDVPQSEIDGYMDPFYRVIAAGLGSGRFAPLDGGNPAWELGLQAGLVPLPDRDPFRATSLSALPVFRFRAGWRRSGLGTMARGLAWRDPRMGNVAAYGAGLSFGRAITAAPVPVEATLMGGWDGLFFSSEYTYRYRGSALGLFDQDVPGDYTLRERVLAAGLMVSARIGAWRPYLQGWIERVSGRFSYLYVDPRDGANHTVESKPGFPGARACAGAAWRGFHIEAGYLSGLSLEAGWSWVR